MWVKVLGEFIPPHRRDVKFFFEKFYSVRRDNSHYHFSCPRRIVGVGKMMCSLGGVYV
jgi:hypothetical protein